MESDEQIRQIILGMADEATNEFSRSYLIICKTQDSRFMTIARGMLAEDDSAIQAALNTILYAVKFYSSEYLPQVLPFLDNPLHWTKAIQVISKIGNASVLPRILPFLFNADLASRVAALQAVFALKHPDIFEICRFLSSDKEADIRADACAILGRLKNTEAVELLIEKLHDNSPARGGCVAGAAVMALGYIKDKRAVEPLKNVVRYGSKDTSMIALQVLWEIEGVALEAFYLEQLQHPDKETRQEAVRLVGELGKDDYIDVLLSIAENDQNPDIQASAGYALEAIGTQKALAAAKNLKEQARRKS